MINVRTYIPICSCDLSFGELIARVAVATRKNTGLPCPIISMFIITDIPLNSAKAVQGARAERADCVRFETRGLSPATACTFFLNLIKSASISSPTLSRREDDCGIRTESPLKSSPIGHVIWRLYILRPEFLDAAINLLPDIPNSALACRGNPQRTYVTQDRNLGSGRAHTTGIHVFQPMRATSRMNSSHLN